MIANGQVVVNGKASRSTHKEKSVRINEKFKAVVANPDDLISRMEAYKANPPQATSHSQYTFARERDDPSSSNSR